MGVYMIGYDLNREGNDYAKRSKALIDRIKELFKTYWHHLDSTWLVVTDLSATAIRNDLRSLLDEDDELLVARLNGEAAWHGFSGRGQDWLGVQLKKA